ncbi:MAG: tRNA 2-thiocytidine biosynthesis protein TtcA [Methanoregula sp. PtaU1.Bin051]|nr:MAG: tRNA 2-thiocytidine biosynthesis protein TtcA [Methanoregula sp. PtaU1.Bin051]
MRCDKCRKTSVIHQPYSGLHLCRDHFIADFEAKAKRAIRTHGWLSRGDHIAVDLSGGAAGSALLHFLLQLVGRRRDITLSAIIIQDRSLGNERSSEARAFAESAGVSCISVSFAEEYGISPADIGREHGVYGLEILRRSLLHRVARKQGISRLALGTSIDEEAESVLAQVLSGTPDRLLPVPKEATGPVSEIRPFMYALSEEIAMYSRLATGMDIPEPYLPAGDVFASDVRGLLHEYSLSHPSAPYSLVSLREQLAAPGMPVQDAIHVCQTCGSLYFDACTACRILAEVRCHAT